MEWIMGKPARMRRASEGVSPDGDEQESRSTRSRVDRPTAHRSRWSSWLVLVIANVVTPVVQATGVSVSDSGTPNYSYPIAVPPGITGMAPQIGLFYSGNGINGPEGYGWSVQGISSITRCAAIPATDGVRKGVAYVPADKLCLDGQRLIQTDANGAVPKDANGVPLPQTNDSQGLAAGVVREYRTEKDTYARIRAYGIANNANGTAGIDSNGPAYFKVWTKSGQIYEYGGSPSADTNTKAAIYAQGKNVVAAWAASRISDTVGNYIDFKYEQRDVAWGSGPSTGPLWGHEWNIAEIQYTGHGTQVPANKVIFNYADRTDRSEAYHQGSKNVSVRLLQSIQTYINSDNPTALGAKTGAVLVKTLKLSYDTGPVSNRSRLKSITECAGATAAACLPPTSFTYAAGGNEAYTADANFPSSPLATQMIDPTGQDGVLLGDFNGDGRTDVLRWKNPSSGNFLYLSTGDGGFTQSSVFNITNESLFSSDRCYTSIAADFNGDGATDILRLMRATSASYTSCGTLNHVLFLARGDGSFQAVPVTGIDFSQLPSLRQAWYDCVLWSRTVCIEHGTTYLGTSQTAGANFFLIDVNGDGILDIVTTATVSFAQTMTPPTDAQLCASTVCTHVFLGSTSGAFTEFAGSNLAHESVYAPVQSGYSYRRLSNAVDVTGDGLSDLFVSSGVWASRGDGNFDHMPYNVGLVGLAGCSNPIDFNGDGRGDCVFPNSSASLQELWLSDGSNARVTAAGFNLVNPGQELSGVISPLSGAPDAGIEIADINGDGRSDILRWRDDPTQNAVYLSNGDGSFSTSTTFNLGGAAGVQMQKSDGTASVFLGDFTGHGTAEFLRLKSVGSLYGNMLYRKLDPTAPDQLTQVTSSTGVVTKIRQVPLSSSAAPYATNVSGATVARYVSDRGTANAATWPKVDITMPSYVVANLETDSGVGSSTTSTEYFYQGLKSTYDGRGSLGFRQTAQQRMAPNGEALTVWTQYLQSYPYIGMAWETDTRRGSIAQPTATLLSSSTFAYCDPSSATTIPTVATPCPIATTIPLIVKPNLYQSVETGFDLDGSTLPSVTTRNTFNNSGDATRIVVTTSGTATDNNLAQTFTKTTVNGYKTENTGGDNWLIGRLETATVTNTVPNYLGSIPTNAGTAPNATATYGTAVALTPTISPSPISLTQASAGTFTAAASVAVGGFPTPPITYAWTRVAPSTTALITATPASGNSNTTTFSATLGLGQSASETFQVTATDAVGRTGSTTVPIGFAVTTTPLAITSVSPAAPSASLTSPGVVSTSATVAITGGLAPFTYSWTRLTGSRITVTNPSSATATFSATLGWSENLSESFQILVTDAIGQMKTASVTVLFTSPPLPPPALTLTSCSTPGATIDPTPATYSCVLGNSGLTTATSISYAVPAGTTLSAAPTSCAASSTNCGTVTVTSGTTAGTYSGTLTATPNVGSAASIVLSIVVNPHALLTANPASLGFSAKQLLFATKSVTVTNSSAVNATVLSTKITNVSGMTTGSTLIVAGSTCPAAGSSLAAGASCTLTIEFNAGCTAGTLKSNLTVAGSNFPSLVVPLSGVVTGSLPCVP